MIIEFKVNKVTQTSNRFCRYILKWIKHDILTKRGKKAIQMRLDLLPYMHWMSWVGKPHNISADMFIRQVANSISYTIRNNTFIIFIDEYRVLPGTYTPILKIVKYIDYGNELVAGTMFFSSVMLIYRKRIYDYWFAYKLRAQQK